MNSPQVTAFTSGELSGLMLARPDLAKYHNGCRVLENFIVYPQGGATRRGGTRLIADTKDTDTTRLIPFIFSSTQAYVLEFTGLGIRVFMNQGRVEVDGEPYEINSPYRADDLFGVKWAQSHDVMWLFHPDYPVHKLSRIGHTNWTMEEIDWLDGPYLDENVDGTTTINPSDTSGQILLHASRPVFTEDHVGALFRLRHNGESVKRVFNSSEDGNALRMYGKFWVDITPDVEDGFAGKITLQKSYNDSDWLDVGSFHYSTKESFFEAEPNVKYRLTVKNGDYEEGSATTLLYQEEAWGVCRVTEIINDVNANATVVVKLGGTSATTQWAEGAWSKKRGYPSCATFHENRMWAGGTKHQPQTIWGSWSDDYENHMPNGDTDDAALSYTLLSHATNAIQWMLPQRALIVGSIGGEWQVSGGEKPISATNINVVPHTAHGSAQNMTPVRIGPSILFVQAARRKVRELSYSFEKDSLVAPDLTLISHSITQSGIRDMAYQQEPWSTLWCVRSDGMLVGCTHQTSEEVVAWHRHPMDGQVKSVACIPSSMGTSEGRDEVWLVVRRTLGGEVKQFVEVMVDNQHETSADQVHLDCSLSYSGTPASAVSGLSHLNGELVHAVGDGAYLGSYTVQDGAITLRGGSYSKVHVGLMYTSVLSPMPFELGNQQNTSQDKVSRVSKVRVYFFETIAGKVGSDIGRLDPIPFRKISHEMGQPPPMLTEPVMVDFPGPYGIEPRLYIVQDKPLPMTILNLTAQVKVNG